MLEFPASYAQERMWFFHRLDPGNPSYNVPLLLRLRGRLDPVRLERALESVAERHEILRTTYGDAGGELRQRVHERPAVPFDQVAVDTPVPAQVMDDPAVAGLVRDFVRAPFDLAAGSPLRARLLRLGPDDHLLMLCQHHIATDGWSLGVLVRELDASYRDVSLPDPPIQYADYAEWQRATVTGETLDAELDHWRSRLGENPPRLTLPQDRPRPEEPSFRGARVDFAISPETSEALRAVARRHGASLYMTLLAAWSALLHRYGAGGDIVVGTLLANRENEQVASLLGLFVNTLPLRVDLTGEPVFAELLGRVRTATLDVLAHQDTPTEKIVERVRPDREGGGNPLFQVLFALQNFASRRLELGGLDVERVDDEEESTRFDLELHVWEHPGHLRGALVFDLDLFDHGTAERMAGHLRALLDAVSADPDLPLTAPALRTEEDERRLRDLMAARGRAAVLDGHGHVPPEGVPGDVWEGRRTGERGRVLPDGTVEIFAGVGPDGRLPDVVRADGRRVVRADLEEALLRAEPALADVVVVPRVRRDTGAAEPVAYVVPAGPVDLDALAGALPVPVAVVPVSALPLSSDGEVDTRALLRLPVADADEAVRLERRLGEGAAVLVAETGAEPLARVPVPPFPEAGRSPAPEPESGAPSLADGGPPADPGFARLGDALVRAAESAPEGRADIVVIADDGGERSLTYGELLDRSLRTLAGLRALGLEPGDPVLLQLGDHADFMTVLWAAVLGGFVAVPLAAPEDYRRRGAAVDRFHGAWDTLERPLVVTAPERLAEIREAAREHGWDDLRVTAPDDLARGHAPADAHPAESDDPVLYLLTSGSTGRPKVVVLRHRNILARSAATAALNDLGPDEVSFNWMPLDHVGGVVMFHLRDVILGCRQVHAPTNWILRDPLRWPGVAHRHRATVTWAPNFAFGLVADRAADLGEPGWDLSRLRFVMNAGEPIVSRVARRWLRVLAPYGLPATAMRPAWGMSETSSAMTYSDRFTLGTTGDDDPFVEVGRPLPGCAARVVGEDGLTVLPEGRTGRLQVRGTTVTSGYHDAPERNAEAFTADGWFDTGDLGRIQDGRLTLTGRAKDVIIVNGVNHHSHEIEAAVEELDCVEPSFTAAVAVRPAGATTDELVVFVHLRTDAGDAPRLVRQAVLDRTGVNPRHVVPVGREDIPKTEIGKIQRSLLRTRFEAGAYAELLPADDSTSVPGHFHRPVWVRRNLPGTPEKAPSGDVLLLLGEDGPGEDLAALLGKAGRRCLRAEVARDGTEFARLGQDHYAVARGSAEGYRRLREALGGFPPTVVHLRSCGAPAGQARAEALDLLCLAREAAGVTELYAVTTDPDGLAGCDRASLAGLIASLAHERPDTRVVHVGLGPEAGAAQLAAELGRLPRERAVAHRSGRRLVRRLVLAETSRTGAVPIRSGGRYLVTGADGGIGRLLVAELAGPYGTRVLALGRTGGPAVPGVERAVADVRDRDALAGVLRDAERRWGAPLDGVFHLAGRYAERPLDRCAPADLEEILAAKVEGARNLHELLGDRPGTLFVSFSSVNGLFGGASVGAYAAANAYLDALAVHQRRRGLDAYSLAWSMWDEVGMSAGYPLKALTESRGYRVLPADEALRSLRVALGRDAPHQLIGLDPARPWVASHLTGSHPLRRLAAYTESGPVLSAEDRYGTPLGHRTVRLDALPRDPGTGEVDRARLAGTGPRRAAEPREGLETVIATTWAEVLGLTRVGAEENFFDLGGGSLQATRVHGLLEERLERELSMVELFRCPTVRSLADALEPGREQAPAGGRGRSRAERRLRAAGNRP
ncbi:SDR family NAD(P)-dependent oxidoreductase [Actinomadura sp. DC4]|uniref:SDR family NAD(P)-dependent oxidoreductase n=1 Tax=Actinomadura sp. DC4 TaxID=3055069 RepID=UPI0025B17CD0|nr:SDR family NAD(P)-dependent oxidoreductase [Actinomadura sp. DC4]MDN3356791.1 SDR family NAD(P)-dependent oxidoreductase [Actinomadura sp. DC4]